MDQETLLKRIGLDEHQASVYLALLSLGQGSPSDIERKTKLHRPLVYQALAPLIEKQLVKVAPNGKRKVYFAESPDKLTALFRELENTFFNNIEDLHKKHETAKNKPVVTFAEGNDAIKNSYMDVVTTLNKDDTYYRYFAGNESDREKYLPKEYRLIRQKKGLERLIICSDKSRKKVPSFGAAIKSIPKEYDIFDYGIGQVIYSDKVAIIDYKAKTVTTIEDSAFAAFQTKLFKLLYSKL
jgi:sugar-specific transcriptional regulator TrmB